MIISNPKKFIITLPKKGKLLGIDLGEKRIGLSISDKQWNIGTPFTTLIRKKNNEDIKLLINIIRNERIIGIVIGWPIKLNGEIGTQCVLTQYFIKTILLNIKLPILKWDERLSTIAVKRIIIQSKISQKKYKKIIDKVAATYILQGFLDYIAYNKK